MINQCVKEEIKKEVRKHLNWIKMETQHIKIYKMSLKQYIREIL